MADKDATQRTPQGAEIPIPKRKDFDRILGKVAKPAKRPSKGSPRGAPEQ